MIYFLAILEFASNLSNFLDIILLVIAAATVFYGLKVKFVGAAEKASTKAEEMAVKVAAEVEKKICKEHDRVSELWSIVNTNANDISALKERTRHL